MPQYGSWRPYEGSEAQFLAVALFDIGCIVAFWGTRIHSPVEVRRPGTCLGILLVLMWCLSFMTLMVAAGAYGLALYEQIGAFTPPENPISPITFLSGLVNFSVITYLTRQHGLKIAFGSAMVGTIAAPMIFELPVALIVMGRTYPPQPAAVFTLLFFLPLFLWEISSVALLTLSPVTRLSKYTLFSLAAMFFVFAIWALFGFSYPSSPIPFVLNVVSKIVCFVTAITLFLPRKAILVN